MFRVRNEGFKLLIFRHDVANLSPMTSAQLNSFNLDKPYSKRYSRLDEMEKFRYRK